MGYNDPVGDNHEQSNLLGSTRGRLSADSQALFGTTKIKHSDFRVGSIKSIKITVLGHEDFAAYVDKNASIKASFAQEKNLTKEQFGANHWKDYVTRRSGLGGQKTTDQFVMYYDRVVKTYTWNAPTETTAGTVSTNFAAPIEIPLEFGNTIEFEVQFDQMAPNFEKYRRYMYGLYSWQLHKQTGTLSTPLPLPTSRGCANNRHAFQARYMFTNTQFTGDQTWLMTFRPKDRFNNHDNMDLTRAWGACAILKPKPVTGVTLSTTATIANKTSGIVCTANGRETVSFTGQLRGLTTGKTGDATYVWQRDRVQSKNLAVFGTAATDSQPESSIKSARLNGSGEAQVLTPGKGGFFTYNFKAYAEVSGNIYNYDGNILANWSYKIDSTSNMAITLSRTPDTDNSYINGPRLYESNTDSKIARYDKKRFKDLTPGRWPSVLVDADAGSTPRKLSGNWIGATQGDVPNKLFNVYANSLANCENILEYHEDGQWKQAYSIPSTKEQITGADRSDYDILKNKTFWSYSPFSKKVESKAWPQSGPWRVTKKLTVNNQPGACSTSTPAIHIATMSQWDVGYFDANPVVTTTFSGYSNITGTWDACPQHNITLKDENNQDVSYTLNVKYEVKFKLLKENSSLIERDILTKIVDTSKYEVSKSDSRLFISGRRYKMTVSVIHCGYDMVEPTVEKRWQRFHSSSSKPFEILDCADPDIRDADTGVEYGDDSTITFVNRVGHKHKSHDIMWHQPNDWLDLTACRDYGSPSYWYEYVVDTLKWEDARTAAEQKGGRLVVLNTQQKTDHFLQWFKNESGVATGVKCWTGLNAVPSNPQWITGESINYNITPTVLWEADGNWSTWESNTGASIYITNNTAGVATDDHEARIKLTGYIVEYSGDGPSYRYNSYQYIAGSFTHSEATNDAAKRGGRLAVLKNNTDLQNMIAAWKAGGSQLAYIGLVRDFSRGWDNTNGWKWADGTWIEEYGVRHWGGGEPNHWNEGAVHVGWHGERWNDCVSHYRQGYMLEKPGVDPSYVVTDECVGATTQQVADITCYVRRDTTIRFSGLMKAAMPAKTITNIPANFRLGTHGNAETTFYFDSTADNVLNTSKSNSMRFTPVTSTSAKPRTVSNFFAVMYDDDDDTSAPGNRGNVSIERDRYNTCKIVIEDPGADILSGPAHSTAPFGSDLYKFKIYANVI